CTGSVAERRVWPCPCSQRHGQDRFAPGAFAKRTTGGAGSQTGLRPEPPCGRALRPFGRIFNSLPDFHPHDGGDLPIRPILALLLLSMAAVAPTAHAFDTRRDAGGDAPP